MCRQKKTPKHFSVVRVILQKQSRREVDRCTHTHTRTYILKYVCMLHPNVCMLTNHSILFAYKRKLNVRHINIFYYIIYIVNLSCNQPHLPVE